MKTFLAHSLDWLDAYLVRPHYSTNVKLRVFARNNKLSVDDAILVIMDTFLQQDEIELANNKCEEINNDR